MLTVGFHVEEEVCFQRAPFPRTLPSNANAAATESENTYADACISACGTLEVPGFENMFCTEVNNGASHL